MEYFLSSPVIPLVEAAISVAFLFALLYRNNINYLYPVLMLTLPVVADVASIAIGGPAEYPIYYLSLAAISIGMMIKMFDFRHEFTAKSFFVLTFVCVILAVITTYIQLSDNGTEAKALGLVFIICWWLMDGLVIWMAINGKFTRDRAKPS